MRSKNFFNIFGRERPSKQQIRRKKFLTSYDIVICIYWYYIKSRLRKNQSLEKYGTWRRGGPRSPKKFGSEVPIPPFDSVFRVITWCLAAPYDDTKIGSLDFLLAITYSIHVTFCKVYTLSILPAAPNRGSPYTHMVRSNEVKKFF